MAKFRPRKVSLKPYILKVHYDLTEPTDIGEYKSATLSLHFKRGTSNQQLKTSIVHEIIHHGLEPLEFLKHKEEELICRTMERLMLSFIKENKKLIAWIQEEDLE